MRYALLLANARRLGVRAPTFLLLLHASPSGAQRFRSGNRLVNPDFAGKGRWFGSASYEALRVTLVGNIEHLLALPQEVFRLTIVNHRWRQQAYPRVTVLPVVPPKKTLTESTTVLNAPKAVRELRPILERAELTLGIRIVVRNVRPTMRFRDA